MKHVDKKNIDDHILHDCKSKTMIEISERLNQGVSSIDQSIDLTSLITKETPLPKGPHCQKLATPSRRQYLIAKV